MRIYRIPVALVIAGLAVRLFAQPRDLKEEIHNAVEMDRDLGEEAASREAKATSTFDPRQIRFQFTGNRFGYLRPCSCTGIEGSGADAERTLVRSLEKRRAPLVRVDSGGFASPDFTDIARIRTAFLIQALSYLRLDAINVDPDDLNVGIDTLLEAARRYHLPFISANLHRAGSPHLIFPPDRIVEARDRAGHVLAHVGIIGISPEVPPDYPPNVIPRNGLPGYPHAARSVQSTTASLAVTYPREYRTSPARQALVKEVARLRPHCEIIVVLTHLGINGVKGLAEGISGIDIIVAGGESAVNPDAGRVGSARIVTPGYKGTAVGELLLDLDAKGAISSMKGTHYFLSHGQGLDLEMTALNQTLLDVESLCDLRPAPGSPGAPGSIPSFVGALSCRDCHFDLYGLWAGSAHAVAEKALSSRHEALEPLCMSCHTTGYGRRGGYVSPEDTPGREGVQCESCHGPADSHVAWAYRDWRLRFRTRPGEPPPTPLPPVLPGRVVPETCRSCHSSLSDPEFPWGRVRQAMRPGAGASFPHDLSDIE